jgi:hypothetical protein
LHYFNYLDKKLPVSCKRENREPRVYTSLFTRLSFPLKISTTIKEILSEKSVSVNGGMHLGASHGGIVFGIGHGA